MTLYIDILFVAIPVEMFSVTIARFFMLFVMAFCLLVVLPFIFYLICFIKKREKIKTEVESNICLKKYEL